MRTEYICEGCLGRYTDVKKAIACEDQPSLDFEDPPKIGQVIACAYPAYGWWEGDKNWRVYKEVQPGARFLNGYYPLWVVVDRQVVEHKYRYILWTPSHASGHPMCVWTCSGHTEPYYEREATSQELQSALDAYKAMEGRPGLI